MTSLSGLSAGRRDALDTSGRLMSFNSCSTEGVAYVRAKNTSARLRAKNAGGAYARVGHICGTLQYNLLPIGNIAVQKHMGNVFRYCLGTCNRL